MYENRWYHDTHFLAWKDVSFYMVDLMDLYRAVYAIDKEFADIKIVPLYHKSLRIEEFTDKQASIIAGEAYDRGHSAGQYEVMSYIHSISIFSRSLIDAGK